MSARIISDERATELRAKIRRRLKAVREAHLRADPGAKRTLDALVHMIRDTPVGNTEADWLAFLGGSFSGSPLCPHYVRHIVSRGFIDADIEIDPVAMDSPAPSGQIGDFRTWIPEADPWIGVHAMAEETLSVNSMDFSTGLQSFEPKLDDRLYELVAAGKIKDPKVFSAIRALLSDPDEWIITTAYGSFAIQNRVDRASALADDPDAWLRFWEWNTYTFPADGRFAVVRNVYNDFQVGRLIGRWWHRCRFVG